MKLKQVTRAADLTGPEKAAVVMLALGEEASRPLWASFDEDELREVTRAISTLGPVNSGVVEELLAAFVDGLSATGSIAGSTASAERFLQNVLPADRARVILDDIKGPAGKTMWDKLANVSERTLAGYLRNEHPQTIAVILSRVRPDHAAKVIGALPALLGEEVVNRLLTLGPVQKEVLDQIELTLRTEFMASISRGADRDPFEAVAEIFNHFDRSTERRFMEALGVKNPSAAERIRKLMFVFDDLIRLDSADMQTLLRRIDKSVLAVALKGARPDVVAHFFVNMSDRAASLLRDDLEVMGPTRVKDIDAAQQKIIELARDLGEAGEIVLSKANDEELIY